MQNPDSVDEILRRRRLIDSDDVFPLGGRAFAKLV
jgi:hypothetical protein